MSIGVPGVQMNTSQSNEKIDRTHLHQPQDHAQTGCWCQERSVFLRSCNAVISKFKSWHGCCLMAKVMNKTVSAKKETLCINPQLTQAVSVKDVLETPSNTGWTSS